MQNFRLKIVEKSIYIFMSDSVFPENRHKIQEICLGFWRFRVTDKFNKKQNHCRHKISF